MSWHERRGKPLLVSSAILLIAGAATGCAGWDNPTALAELDPSVNFEISTDSAETFAEVEIVVRIMEGNTSMAMRDTHLEIESAGGAVRTIEMEARADGFGAHVVFYRAGEHHLHFRGTPQRHHLSREWGDQEMEVGRHHAVIGTYWVEVATKPAPVFEHTVAHVELFVFELASDGSRGAAVSGLPVRLEIHDPSEVSNAVTVSEEESGEYAGEFEFGAAGSYELHIELGQPGVEVSGELSIPILDPNAETPGNDPGEGEGHGHE